MTDEQLSKLLLRAAEEETVELDLSWREIRSLPATIARLTKLQRLSLASNWLQELPPELAQLPNLKALDVSDNLLGLVLSLAAGPSAGWLMSRRVA